MRNPFRRYRGRHRVARDSWTAVVTVDDLLIRAADDHPDPWLGLLAQLDATAPRHPGPARHRDGTDVTTTIARARSRPTHPWTLDALQNLKTWEHQPKPWVLPQFQWPDREAQEPPTDPFERAADAIASMSDVLADLTADPGIPVDPHPDRLYEYEPRYAWDCTVGPDPHDGPSDELRDKVLDDYDRTHPGTVVYHGGTA